MTTSDLNKGLLFLAALKKGSRANDVEGLKKKKSYKKVTMKYLVYN